MPAPDSISSLVRHFQSNLEDYRNPHYNETQLRQEFINPFFIALGWDVNNVAGAAEAYKPVVHEDAVKVSGATKAPDYSFRIGGTRKFFVETKKPAVKIAESGESAFQLRRYAWSAKLALSILTDFEEFAVYDCRVKPAHTDKASAARIMLLPYTDYLSRWEELCNIFSPEAILRGSFDRFAESEKLKKGTARVDDAFLSEIERWRDELARSIAVRNPSLSVRELNFAVQRIIDRIVFLRICEDRGVEEYGRLQALLNGGRVYPRLVELFLEADQRYNSGLFHFRPEKDRPEPPDELTTGLEIDDKALKDILKNLYYPDSPYEFSVFSADILGQVYEQFLGKVIRLTAGHHAVVEDKPEVKKAGGVYYTPVYIVEYIVKNTVGKLLSGKTLRSMKQAPIRILDPACGSGSFLIQAYQYLLDWYGDKYVADGAQKHGKEVYRGAAGVWRLSTAERKRILLAHIFGVDIDPQAVEVTKLSLLLKVLEGETYESLNRQMAMFHERALPDLGGNIKCGNSLIGSDYFAGRAGEILHLPGKNMDDEYRRINPFDWNAEFAEIMEGGGFDTVIGNPPYVVSEISKDELNYFKEKYKEIIKGRTNLYAMFIYRSLNLLRYDGYFGYIIPKTYMGDSYFKNFREYLFNNHRFSEILDIEDRRSVFKGVLQSVNILLMRNGKSKNFITNITRVISGEEIFQKPLNTIKIQQNLLRANICGYDAVIIDSNKMTYEIFDKLSYFPKFEEIGIIAETGKIQWDLYKNYLKRDHEKDTVRLIWAENIQRYYFKESKQRIGKEWFECKGSKLTKGIYSLGQVIVTQRVTAVEQPRRIIATYLNNEYFNACIFENHTNVITSSSQSYLFLLGILNSLLFDFVFRKVSSNTQVSAGQLNRFPIRTINFSDPADVARHDQMVSLVETMLSLHKKLPAARTPEEKTLLQRQIESTDKQIDTLVYELYGLTDEEIRVVEGG